MFMMKLNIIFLVCVAGVFNVCHGAPGKRHAGPENDLSRRSNGKSLYRRPEYENEKDQKSAKQRREVGGVQKRSCDADEFQCTDGSFVIGSYRCDTYVDCADRSDELDCGSCCTGFLCKDRACIAESWKCDGEPDCDDGSDEGSVCDNSCLPLDSHQVCNHEWDCESGFDESDCEPMPLGTSVTIASKNYDSTYPNDLIQIWTFEAAQGFVLTLTFKDFETEATYDELFVGTDTDEAVEIFSGTEYTDFTTDGTTLWLLFVSDSSVGFKGFQAVVTVDNPCLSLDSHQVCNHEWDCAPDFCCESGFDESNCEPMPLGTSVTIASKDYDSTYPVDLNQTWTFEAAQGFVLTLTIKDFETEATYDELFVGTGKNPDTDKAVKIFSGTTYTDFTTDGTTLWLQFVSDSSIGLKGFQAVVTVTDEAAETSDDIDYCGYNNYIAQPRIINGVDTNIEEWPWQVMLLQKTDSYYQPYYFKCGGTLISDRHVLTAAHCVDTGGASDYQIALGKNHTSLQVNEGLRRDVAVLAIHEGFSRNSYDYDIAVLTLDAPVTIPSSDEDLQIKFSINTACVDHPGNHWDENDKCFITGYGHVNGTTEQKSERLQEAKVKYMDHVDCEANSNFGTGQLSPTMICGGGVDGSDSCQGDSGGPLVCRHSMLNYYVVGITSFGKGCGEEGWPGVYTSVESYSTWIMDKML